MEMKRCRILFRLNGSLLNVRELSELIDVPVITIYRRCFRLGFLNKADSEQVVIDLNEKVLNALRPLIIERNKPQSICWLCDNSSRKSCPLADRNVPVDGWDAQKVKLRLESAIVDSYIVKECPMFDDANIDEQFRTDWFNLFETEYKELYVKVIGQTVKDYADALVRIRSNPKAVEEHRNNPYRKTYSGDSFRVVEECEKFFRSDMFESILVFLKINRFTGEQFIQAIEADPERFAKMKEIKL